LVARWSMIGSGRLWGVDRCEMLCGLVVLAKAENEPLGSRRILLGLLLIETSDQATGGMPKHSHSQERREQQRCL
jgi:hypothetical protein